MIKITHLNPTRGRISATFTAEVGGLVLPGCALIRRGDGYALSVPRIGAPGETRPAPLSAVMEAELLRVAMEQHLLADRRGNFVGAQRSIDFEG